MYLAFTVARPAVTGLISKVTPDTLDVAVNLVVDSSGPYT